MVEYNLEEGIEKARLMIEKELYFKKQRRNLKPIRKDYIYKRVSREKEEKIYVTRDSLTLISKENNVLVNVVGGSASGKTSAVSLKLKEIFQKQSAILSIDDYYYGKSFMKAMEAKGIVLNWDQPEALELELLVEHIKYLKQGLQVLKPKYSFKTGERQGYEYFYPKKVIIVEGLFRIEGCDIYIFVNVGLHGRMLRRLFRDIERTNNKPEDILRYFAEIVEPMNEKYVDPAKAKADIVIKNEFNPVIEAKNSGLHEVQLKFYLEREGEITNKPGVMFLELKIQSDYYYNPKDRNLMETEETLRIRKENNDKIIFTYKGPKEECGFRKRPKFEFEIDEETEKSFVGIYGDMIKAIHKVRNLYQYKNIVFSIDSVVSYEGGVMRPLGKFVEIREVGNENYLDAKNEIEELGLNIEDGIKKSYFEM